jgi:hypothetical protein
MTSGEWKYTSLQQMSRGRESEIEVESESGSGREAGRRIRTVGRMGVGREEARLLAMWRVARLLAPNRGEPRREKG